MPNHGHQRSRVLRLFRLSAAARLLPARVLRLPGRARLRPRVRRGQAAQPRAARRCACLYRLSTAASRLVLHLTCSSRAATVRAVRVPAPSRQGARLPDHHVGERLYCGATLLVERWANPMLELDQPTGLRARVRRHRTRAHVDHHRRPAAVRAPAAAALHVPARACAASRTRATPRPSHQKLHGRPHVAASLTARAMASPGWRWPPSAPWHCCECLRSVSRDVFR